VLPVRTILALLLLSLLAGCSLQPTSERVSTALPMREGWSYRWGDSPKLGEDFAWAKGGAGQEWTPVSLPSRLPGRPSNYLWMRLRVPSNVGEGSALYLRLVDQNFTAFVDGRRVYQFGNPDHDGKDLREGRPWHLVPLGAGDAGKWLTLRIFSEHLTIGVFGTPMVGLRSDLTQTIVSTRGDAFALGIGCLALALCALFFLLAVSRNLQVVFFLIAAFGAGFYSITCTYSPVKQLFLDAPELLWYVEIAGLYLIPVGYLGFNALQLSGRGRQIVGGFALYLAAYFVVSLGGALSGAFRLMATLSLWEASISVAGLASMVVAAVTVARGRRETVHFLVEISAFFVAAIHDTMIDAGLLNSEDYIVFWAFLIWLGSMALSMVRGYQKLQDQSRTYMGELAQRNAQLDQARGQLARAAEDVRREASGISGAATEQAARSQREAAGIVEVSSTVAHVAEGSAKATAHAESVAEASRRSEELHRGGEAAVREAVEVIERLSERVGATALRITELSQAAREMGEIVGKARDVAEQSNMLAVNAALEAARAGEQGLGFGVIAREMRTLALESGQAADRIRQLIVQVQGGIQAAEEAGQETNHFASLAVERARKAGGTITELARVIQESSRLAEEITSATRAQTSGLGEVAHAIQSAASAYSEVADSARRVEQTAKALDAVSHTLAEMVQRS